MDPVPKKIARNIVCVDEPCIQSRASYIMLIKGYYKLGDDNRWAWLKFRDRWMKRQYEKYGVLTCCHCGATNLKFGGVGYDVATVDHIIPISRGGSRFDEDNLQIMCRRCNGLRGNKSMEEFQKNYPGGKHGRT